MGEGWERESTVTHLIVPSTQEGHRKHNTLMRVQHGQAQHSETLWVKLKNEINMAVTCMAGLHGWLLVGWRSEPTI